MAKAELGTKRVCPETGRKFYDLNKDPVISPYTGKVVPIEVPTTRSRPEQAQPAPAARPAAVAEEAAVPETARGRVCFPGGRRGRGAGIQGAGRNDEADIEEEVEMDETLDDAAFIEEQEEEDADVTDIIGGDIENEEEG